MRRAVYLFAAVLGAQPIMAQPPAKPGASGALPRLSLPASSQPGKSAATAPAPVVLSAPPPLKPAPMAEKLRTFDPTQVRLAWNNRRWQIVHHEEVLKDFGARQQEARQALRLIHELGLNQHGVIGSGAPVMEYWLSNGKAPRGLIHGGLRAIPVEAARLEIQEVRGQWCLRDGAQVLFSFGPRQDEARQALAVIRKYGFNQVGVLGQGAPSMYVFFNRTSEGVSPRAEPQRATLASTKGTPFSRVAKNSDGTPRVEMPATREEHPLAAVVTPTLPPLPPAPTARPTMGGHRPEEAWRAQAKGAAGANPPAAASGPLRIPFDWRQVQLEQKQGEWRLRAGSLILAHFGPHVHEARMALAALRHYRFTEQYKVGETPGLTYYLPGGQSPRGVMLGLPGTLVQPEQLAVQQVGGGFALCQGQRVLLRMGERQEEAKKLLDTIKTHKLDRLCQIGDPGAGMTILVRSR